MINLLPQKQKADLKNEQKFRLGIFAISWASFTILTLCLLFYASSAYLTIQQQSLDENLLAQKSNPRWAEVLSSEKQLKNLGARINEVLALQSKERFWSPFLSELTNNNVAGINFKNITINTAGKLAVISGHADTRDNVLEFKSALEKNSYISEVKAPLENFLDQTDIDFSFTLLLK